jgi:hypothetical protein
MTPMVREQKMNGIVHNTIPTEIPSNESFHNMKLKPSYKIIELMTGENPYRIKMDNNMYFFTFGIDIKDCKVIKNNNQQNIKIITTEP